MKATPELWKAVIAMVEEWKGMAELFRGLPLYDEGRGTIIDCLQDEFGPDGDTDGADVARAMNAKGRELARLAELRSDKWGINPSPILIYLDTWSHKDIPLAKATLDRIAMRASAELETPPTDPVLDSGGLRIQLEDLTPERQRFVRLAHQLEDRIESADPDSAFLCTDPLERLVDEAAGQVGYKVPPYRFSLHGRRWWINVYDPQAGNIPVLAINLGEHSFPDTPRRKVDAATRARIVQALRAWANACAMGNAIQDLARPRDLRPAPSSSSQDRWLLAEQIEELHGVRPNALRRARGDGRIKECEAQKQGSGRGHWEYLESAVNRVFFNKG